MYLDRGWRASRPFLLHEWQVDRSYGIAATSAASSERYVPRGVGGRVCTCCSRYYIALPADCTNGGWRWSGEISLYPGRETLAGRLPNTYLVFRHVSGLAASPPYKLQLGSAENLLGG